MTTGYGVVSLMVSSEPEFRASFTQRWSDRPRFGRRAALGLGAGAAGVAVVGGHSPAWAGDDPVLPTPDRPPPSSGLFSHAETRLAFRNHGMHLEFLDQPITPVGSHFQLVHFDVPHLQEAGYSVPVKGRVARPFSLSLEDLKRRPQVRQPSIMECAGNGRSFAHPRSIYVPWFQEAIGVFDYPDVRVASSGTSIRCDAYFVI